MSTMLNHSYSPTHLASRPDPIRQWKKRRINNSSSHSLSPRTPKPSSSSNSRTNPYPKIKNVCTNRTLSSHYSSDDDSDSDIQDEISSQAQVNPSFPQDPSTPQSPVTNQYHDAGSNSQDIDQDQEHEDENDDLIIYDDDEDDHEEEQNADHINCDLNIQVNTQGTIQSSNSREPVPFLSTFRDEDDEAARFEQLLQRHEAMQRATLDTNPPSSSEAAEDVSVSLEETQQEHQEQVLNSSWASTSSDRSQRQVEDLLNEEEIRREKALAYLESLVMSFFSQVKSSMLSMDPGCSPQKTSGSSQEGDNSQNGNSGYGIIVNLLNRQTGNDQVFSFPDDPMAGESRDGSAQKLACLYTVAAALYDAILNRTVVTLRDIYYRDKQLFRRQDVVDKLVDDLVATAGLKRKDFYVCASAKGLVASSALKICRRSGEDVVLSSASATLIDPIEKIDHIEVIDGLSWVLVVEKDAIFQTLCSTHLLDDPRLGPGVMITGKGYPDLATRQFLKLIADTFPEARMSALVDADPHGLNILSCYTHGSKKTKYSHDHLELALGDRLEWMGVKASDWKRCGIRHDDLLPLEKADVSLATSMLKKSSLPAEWRRELSNLLHLNRKAEIEIILGSTSMIRQGGIPINNGMASIFDDENDNDGADVRASHRSQSQSHGGAARLVDYVVERLLVAQKYER